MLMPFSELDNTYEDTIFIKLTKDTRICTIHNSNFNTLDIKLKISLDLHIRQEL